MHLVLISHSEQGAKKQMHGNLTWYPPKPGLKPLVSATIEGELEELLHSLEVYTGSFHIRVRVLWRCLLSFGGGVVVAVVKVLEDLEVFCSMFRVQSIHGRSGLMYSEPSSSLMRSDLWCLWHKEANNEPFKNVFFLLNLAPPWPKIVLSTQLDGFLVRKHLKDPRVSSKMCDTSIRSCKWFLCLHDLVTYPNIASAESAGKN